jgi:Cu/Ag efflux protein CusF
MEVPRRRGVSGRGLPDLRREGGQKMKYLMMTLAVSGLIATPMSLIAHEGHKHTTLGTIEQVEEDRLDVKDTAGKIVSFTLNEKTKVLRGKKAAEVDGLKKGERVAVESEEKDGTLFALSVRAGGGSSTQTYVCPMHPEVTSNEPGRCPKCKMFLEPKAKEQ